MLRPPRSGRAASATGRAGASPARAWSIPGRAIRFGTPPCTLIVPRVPQPESPFVDQGKLDVMLWRLVGWLVLALVHRRVALAGDVERRRAEATLREGYAGGYLTLEEFSRRTGRVQSARSRSQLRRLLLGLPRVAVVESVQDVVQVVVTGAYVVFTLALALILGVALLLGASTSTFVVFALVWLVPTFLYVRFRRRH